VNVSPAFRCHAATALLTAAVLAVGVARADAAALNSAVFDPPTLTTQWKLESNDCTSSVSLSDSRAVGVYGFFTGWHVAWDAGGCLATSNAKTFAEGAGTYRVLGYPLPAGTYFVQLQFCHDSDVSGVNGGWYCAGTNVRRVDIPAVGPAGTLSDLEGDVQVSGKPATDGTVVRYGEEVRTAQGASATLTLSGGSELQIAESSVLIPKSATWAKVLSGRVSAHLDGPYRIFSPRAVAVAREAAFGLTVSDRMTRERTYRDSVAFSNATGREKGTVTVPQGYESIVHGSRPPTKPKGF
jgi:hypothetical protein